LERISLPHNKSGREKVSSGASASLTAARAARDSIAEEQNFLRRRAPKDHGHSSEGRAPTKVPNVQEAHAAMIVGTSTTMRESLERLARYSGCTATVLLQGETGTGKELAARRVHYQSSRSNEPFVPVNCGALPESLLESELFGHVRGAFTDARESRPGVIALAHGGTLFLDEVEALSGRAQVVLLRFLESHTYRPLGGAQERHADVRVIAASNRNLARLVREGLYREDLLYRLAVMTLTLPPLRTRGEDVLVLAEHFLARYVRQYRTRPKHLDEAARTALRSHSWPGNVRELENLIHRVFVLTDGDVVTIRPSDFADDTRAVPAPAEPEARPRDFREGKARAVELFEREFVSRALLDCAGNVSLAARRCGKERRAFGRLVKKYGIDRVALMRQALESPSRDRREPATSAGSPGFAGNANQRP